MQKLINARMINVVALSTMVCVVTACSSNVKDTLGFTRKAPDEFRVVSNAPLSLPPEFTLRPPVPGAKRPQEADLSSQAKSILFEESVRSGDAGTSKGEALFLKKANIEDSNPEIKQVLSQEELDKAAAEKKKGFWEKFASATNLRNANEPTVNPTKEKERIVKNSQEGKVANEGEVPVVDGAKKPFFKRIFGL